MTRAKKSAPSSFRLTPDAEAILQQIAEETFTGNRTAAIEWLLRKEAKRRAARPVKGKDDN